MDLGLADRVAMVAASSQGLGKAVALGLAREGAKLALCARTEATLAATAEERTFGEEEKGGRGARGERTAQRSSLAPWRGAAGARSPASARRTAASASVSTAK